MSEKILNFCTISGESVKKFEGIKKYIATGDIIDNKISSYAEVDYSNKPSRANQIAKIGEVIFAKMKDTIKVITINKENSEYIYSTGFYIIKPKANVLTDYLYWLFNSPKFNIDKDKYCKGATQKALNNEGLGKIEINKLPDIKIQENIVYKLNKVNDILNKKKEQLNTLDELIKSQFVEMFGDPVLNEKQWRKVPLGTECNIITGNTPSRNKKEYYGDFIEWIKSDNINTPSNYITQAEEYLSEEGKNVGRTINEDSILMTCIAGSISCIGNVAMTDRKVAFNQQINGIETLKNNTIFMYVQFLLSKQYIQSTINMSLKGILSKGKLSELEFIFPPIELQEQFAYKFQQIDKQKFEIENSLEEMQELYESLTEKYFG